MTRPSHLLWLVVAAVSLAQPALAEDLTTVASKFPVAATVDRLVAALKEKGITPIARIDHAAGARSVGLDMKPTEVLLFGNPRLGTPLMQAAPSVAIDLPMRVLVWEDKDGKTWLGYVAPDTLKARHRLTGVDQQLGAMAGALAGFAKAATE